MYLPGELLYTFLGCPYIFSWGDPIPPQGHSNSFIFNIRGPKGPGGPLGPNYYQNLARHLTREPPKLITPLLFWCIQAFWKNA